MADLIDRKAVMESITAEYNRKGTGDGLRLAWIEKAVNSVPSVTPEQKTGHWIESDDPIEKYTCSNCGGACWYYDYRGTVAKSNYCPNCGAKMEVQE